MSTGTTQHLRIDSESPVPLQAQLHDQLRWLIASGEIAKDTRLPPVRALASELGINFNTVRSAYKQLESDGLVRVRQGQGTSVLGYSRDTALSSRTNVRSFTVGVIIPAHIVFYIPFLNALEASTDPSLLLVCNAQQDPANGLDYFDRLIAKNVDGILVVATMLPRDTDLSDPALPPVVFADYPDAPGPSIVFDHRHGSAAATRHMLEHGHKRIGFLAPSRQIPNVAPKYAGYEEAMSGSGSAASGPIETASDFGIEAGYESALRLLTGDDPPTAIVAATDNHAIATMQAANELGIGIPDDLALIGNDDIFLADVLRPALSSVNVPVAEMGQRAITLLQDMIAGQPAPTEPIRLTPSLVTRRSCGCHPDA